MKKCASFFAGVGGIDIAFEKSGFNVIFANEFNKYAIKTYEENSPIKVNNKDITTLENWEIPAFDIMLAGFPCQPFSIAGERKGFSDTKGRGNLFFELERIFLDKSPEVIFLENVRNLSSHDSGKTLETILERLSNAGYHTKHRVMNSSEYGNIPQNRERIYIVGFKSKKHHDKFDFPGKIPLSRKLENLLDFDDRLDDKYYYNQTNFAKYNILDKEMISSKSIYQWRRAYVRENKSGLCPTLTAVMGTGGHNVPLIRTAHGIRKLTPRECFALQGFPVSFKIPKDVSNSQLYKQAGNSVVVPVIERIAKNILLAIS